jgi:ABC-2 type transport system permease protein
VFLKSLGDLRRSFVWWALGLAGYVAMIVSVYPTIRDNRELERLMEQYPEALKAFFAFGGQLDFTSAAGYLGSELFSFMIPILFLVVAVGNGVASIAGEEERGTLDLLLSAPLSRRRVALEKLGAMCLEVAGLGAVLWLALWIGAIVIGMGISGAHLAAATTSAVLLAIAYGAIAFMLGAGSGRKSLAVGVTVALPWRRTSSTPRCAQWTPRAVPEDLAVLPLAAGTRSTGPRPVAHARPPRGGRRGGHRRHRPLRPARRRFVTPAGALRRER